MAEAAVTALDDAGFGIAVGFPPLAFAAPGDRVRQTDAGIAIDPISPDRAPPPCAVFGRCGGCSLQHLGDDIYAGWKTGRLQRALNGAGLRAPIAPLARSPLASRRRATFAAVARGSSIAFGYRAKRSHDVIDLHACPALAPPLDALLPDLRALAEPLVRTMGEIRLAATLCDNGIDVAITTASPPKARGRKRPRKERPAPPPLSADNPALIRITINAETALMRELPVIALPGGRLTPPPGAFLQATRQGESALIAAVTEAAKGATQVADLFCGIGTFTLPLARRATVLAVESDRLALAALGGAIRPSGTRPVRPLRRNLFTDPLSPNELNRFDAVVFDPPRAGADTQARALAASSVPTVIAVSCEPATLARDCAHLVAGGYKITQAIPVDQFVATSHIEAVVVLRRVT